MERTKDKIKTVLYLPHKAIIRGERRFEEESNGNYLLGGEPCRNAIVRRVREALEDYAIDSKASIFYEVEEAPASSLNLKTQEGREGKVSILTLNPRNGEVGELIQTRGELGSELGDQIRKTYFSRIKDLIE